jgi:hypothetical protein
MNGEFTKLAEECGFNLTDQREGMVLGASQSFTGYGSDLITQTALVFEKV